MAYYRRKKKENNLIGVVGIILVGVIIFIKYEEVIKKIFFISLGAVITGYLFYLIYKIFFNKKTKKEELEEKKLKLQKYFEENKEENETLHVSDITKNIELDWIHNQSKEIKTKRSYHENKKRGDEYEKQIGEYYESLEYKVQYRGFTHGRKDDGIDLIAENENEILLIQCKNWTNSIVKQKDIKEFIGNCTTFLEDNEIEKEFIKRIFITSNQKIEIGLKKYLEQHKNKIEYKVIEFQEK